MGYQRFVGSNGGGDREIPPQRTHAMNEDPRTTWVASRNSDQFLALLDVEARAIPQKERADNARMSARRRRLESAANEN